MTKKCEYYLGLDIGTDSVGFAATDSNYKLIRFNDKNLWGVRLFEPAKTAAERRTNRESRRRLERRKWRIQLLQEIFALAINSIDPNFFMRLDDSNLYDGDKREKTTFSLFNDADFTDRDFHKKYKTIYHLRADMLTAQDPDPRLVYLALHHMIKYRGNFLLDWDVGEGTNVLDDLQTPLLAINSYLAEHDLDTLDVSLTEQLRAELVVRRKKNDRAQNLKNIFAVTSKATCALLDLIAGKSVSVKSLGIDCEDEKAKVCFDGDWDSVEDTLRNLLKDDYVVVENAKILYDYMQIKTLLGDHQYVSLGMIERYEKHKSDLAMLKRVIKKHMPERYKEMFRDALNEKETNYTAYSGKVTFCAKKNGKRAELTVLSKTRSYDDFCAYVKKILNASDEALADPDVVKILEDIQEGTFMPKQVSKNNATLPYQLNLMEMDAILANIRKYGRYAFLNESSDGATTAEKIKSLLTFRIPYYVGPTNNTSGKYWCVRSDASGKILPWNFEQKVDLQQSEEKFIERMTGRCPYLPDEKVLPKCSLLYEEFVFLNIVSSIKINGTLITPEQKQKLSTYFATTGKNKLTKKVLQEWLVSENLIKEGESFEVEGFDVESGASAHRRMYYNFKEILGSVDEVEKHRSDIEKIINYATIAGTEKQNLRKKLHKDFKFLSEQQIKRILGLACKGWGRCSAAFLQRRIGTNVFTGEIKAFSIIDALRNVDGNLNEIYNNKAYGFKAALESEQDNIADEIRYDIVNELYCSPAVKKQIWQSLEIVKEIKRVLGSAPKKIFVEVARGTDSQKERRDEANRTRSRQKQISEALTKLNAQYAEAFDAENNQRVESNFAQIQAYSLSKKKLYLYFLQNGVDIYTGERIDYNKLELYDIDHIYPRSKIKDDSLLNNLVLTAHIENEHKADNYPVNPHIQQKMQKVWYVLKQSGLMEAEKYKRLVRTTELSEYEMADFINRQIVETQQSTKEVIGLLHRIFPDVEVVWSKATNVSDFRKGENGSDNGCIKFVKCRESNDLHHAKDAYLNIVVGNTYNVRYGHDARVYAQSHLEKFTSTAKLFEHDVSVGGKVAWKAGEDGTLLQVQKTMRNNSALFTHESVVSKGQLFNATLYKKGEGTVALKGASSEDRKFALMSNVEKYGGYDSESRVYYMLVKYVEKKGKKTTIKYRFVGVTAKDVSHLTTNDDRIAYFKKDYSVNGKADLVDVKILIPQIKIKTMFEFGGTMLMLSGMTGRQLVWRLAQQNIIDVNEEAYLKKVTNVVEKYNKAKAHKEQIFVSEERDKVSSVLNIALYNDLVEKLSSERYKGASSLQSLAQKLLLPELKQKFTQLNLADQCVVLSEIAKSLQCNALASDLTLLGEGKTCGKILTSATMDSLEGIKIVHRSVTGVFEQKIALVNFDKE